MLKVETFETFEINYDNKLVRFLLREKKLAENT